MTSSPSRARHHTGVYGRIVGLSFIALVVACAPLPTRPIAFGKVDASLTNRPVLPRPSTTGFAPANATPEQRVATLDHVWQAIDSYYYDPQFERIDVAALQARSTAELASVHNDAEFYRVLKRGVAAMHDSHTLVMTPRQAEDERSQQATQIGIVFDLIDDRVVIMEVVPGFPADEQGIRRGMIIDAVDDTPLDAAFFAKAATSTDQVDADDALPTESDAARRRDRQRRAVRALLRNDDDAPHAHRLTLRRADDTIVRAEVLARTGAVPTVERFVMLPSGIGLLRLSRFDHAMLARLDRDIERARVESRGLIIDLRANGGGEVAVFRRLVDHFIAAPASLGQLTARFWDRRVTLTLQGTPIAKPYLKPIAVLIDRYTGSAAELTAHALVELRDAIPVGDPTCGCVVGIHREFVLPDGGVLRVAEASFRSPHDRRMEADPLLPAVTARPTLAEARAGDDVVLHAAEAALSRREQPASIVH